VRNRQLGYYDGGFATVPVFQEFEQRHAGGDAELFQAKIVQDENCVLHNAGKLFQVGSVILWLIDFTKHPRGRFAQFGITEPSIIGAELFNPLIEELTSYGLPVISPDPETADFLDRVSDAEIDVNSVIQEYIITDDPESVVDKVNKKWAEAK